MKKVRNITVIGAGAMGHGIAQMAAMSDFHVVLNDVKDEYLEGAYHRIEADLDRRINKGRINENDKKSILSRITTMVDLEKAVKNADLVIEAVPEILEIKWDLFKKLDKLSPNDCIFATNTSSLSITAISKAIDEPERMVGVHFFNPATYMKLVEIIYGDKTSDETVKAVEYVTRKMGKTAIYVRKDVPAFVVNRIFCPMVNEAAWALDSGEAKSPFEIDSAVKFKMGLPMGMFEISDLLGDGCVDVIHHVMKYIESRLGSSYRPAPLLAKLTEAGEIGKKSGKGFYDWSEGKSNEITLNAGRDFDPIRLLAPAINEAAKLIEIEAANKEDIDTGAILGLNYPRGILRMADDVGLDRIIVELNRLYEFYDKEERYIPSKILEELVKEGKTGRAAGEGFYSYAAGEYEFVRFDVDSETGVAKLVLNRPYRANALNDTFLFEINKVLDVVEQTKDILCLVITGEGRNFCGGADITAFASGSTESIINFCTAGHDVFTRLETLSVPVIAAINGPAIGGGLELALACDLRIMSEKALLQLPELKLGLFPGWGGTQRLPRLIGMSRAKEMILLNRPIEADKALAYGLVNLVAKADDFDSEVNKIAEKIAEGPPYVYKLVKQVLYYGAQSDQRTALFSEAVALGDLAVTEDLSEGITAFRNRRKPKFVGR